MIPDLYHKQAASRLLYRQVILEHDLSAVDHGIGVWLEGRSQLTRG